MPDHHVRIFDAIAPLYDLFFPFQRRSFRRTLHRFGSLLNLAQGMRALDIGCGPGAFAWELAVRGLQVTAIDPSRAMVARARRRLSGTEVEVAYGNPLQGLPYPDRSFDIVLASHVVHGLGAGDRQRFYREALRLSRGLILIHDFPPADLAKGAIDVKVIEFIEGGDYLRFVRRGRKEMEQAFGKVRVVLVEPAAAWYIGSAGKRSSE